MQEIGFCIIITEREWLKAIGCSSLRGGGGEIGTKKPKPMAPISLHKT